MAVTDLTGTTWVFNDSIDVSTSFYYSINFISNDSSFAALEASYPDLSYYYWGAPTTIYSNGWYNANYKTISITGGTDATNSSLISWLEANATQQGGPSITDLTNTTWKFNTSITISTMPYTTNPRSFAVIVYYEPYAEYGNYSSITFSDTRDRGTYNNAVLSGEMPEQYIAGDIEITFLGGTSATDLTLISWLQANATQVVNETYITSDIDLTSVANAIRTKGGTSASLVYPAGYISAINSLPTGALQSYKSAVYTSPGTATILPDSGYVGIEEISVEYSPSIYDGAYHTFIVYPVKGDIINIDMNGDGQNEEYLVLKSVDTTVVEVLARNNISQTASFPKTYIYANSPIDSNLNYTYYNGLSSIAKAAIVDKTFYQDCWYNSNNGSPKYVCKWNPSSPYIDNLGLKSATYNPQITRHIYALSVQDIIDYLEITTSMTSTNTTGTGANLTRMFNITGSSHIWLRSLSGVSSSGSNYCIYIDCSVPNLREKYTSSGCSLRPAFQIDLSKIDWSFAS